MVVGKQINLNKEKTEYMLIGSKQRLDTFSNNRPVISIGEQTIKRVSKKNVLRIIIDENQ
jgi:hypothetical protein